MHTPFLYGKLVSDGDFTDREPETIRLSTNFLSGINTILISPRRWGKSSLVAKAAALVNQQQKEIVICAFDLFSLRSEEDFYQTLAQEVLKATYTKTEQIQEAIRKFLSRLVPKISYGIDDVTDISIGLDWKEVKERPDDILNMAEKIAAERNIKLIVCIDEFQNLSTFADPLAFQKKLRACWQRHKNVSYCLYGSKRNMMLEVFTRPSMPFYKFGDIIFLEKITTEDWISFLQRRFTDTSKSIDIITAALVAQKVENHPYYVQQLAQLSWLRTQKKCSEKIVTEAHEGLILQLSNLFQMLTDGLSNTQVNFLRALINNVEKYSSKAVIEKYQLGTTANISKIRQALLDKEIIDWNGKQVSFIDPVYKAWLSIYYFKIKQ